MHIMKFALSTLVVAATITLNNSAFASTFTFKDNYMAFPGYPSRTPGSTRPIDEYGYPQIDSMTVTLDDTNNFLTKVVLNLRHDQIIRWDSLFINTRYVNLPNNGIDDSTWDQSWDYFVHSGGETTTFLRKESFEGNIVIKDGLYSVMETFDYTKNYTKVVGARNYHPDGIDQGLLTLLDETITGQHSKSTDTITYDFSSWGGGGIAISNGFTIGYTPWCANDVFLASAPVPEPATMLLFGSGIIGIAGLIRNRKK